MTAATANSTRHRPDYYEVLGVPRTADFREIGAAYWRKARRASNEQRAKLNEAYEALNEEDRRREYDAALSTRGGEPAGEASAEPAPDRAAEGRTADEPSPEATLAPPEPPPASVDPPASEQEPPAPGGEADDSLSFTERLGWPKVM
jgi:curved DNA-binding protein CbpA